MYVQVIKRVRRVWQAALDGGGCSLRGRQSLKLHGERKVLDDDKNDSTRHKTHYGQLPLELRYIKHFLGTSGALDHVINLMREIPN